MADDLGTKNVPVEITEDEAAVYDRQIRLWGLEAQQRMRNATILVLRLRGTATETIKNIVLAGIGKLVLVDEGEVMPEDLGAGFFFRDEDVGLKRVDAAKARIQSLNPLVTVETVSSHDALVHASLETLIRNVDMVCVCDYDRDSLLHINTLTRQLGKPLYAGGTYGLIGYIFCDLLQHAYIAPNRAAPNETAKDTKLIVNYVPLGEALRQRWSHLKRKAARELNPAAVFSVLGLWEYQSRHQGLLPDSTSAAAELNIIANELLTAADVNKQALASIPTEVTEPLSTTAAHEFSPVCAVVGGMLAQDMLKAMAAREAPIANLFVFDGTTGAGTVCRLGMESE